MSIMKDSNVDDAWLREVMTKNPPRLLENGRIFTGPVRLGYAALFKPDAKTNDDGKVREDFQATFLFPLGTNMQVFQDTWTERARAKFAEYFAPDGSAVGLHSPFHDQKEKAFGSKPRPGYVPGAIFMYCSSQYKPNIFDANKQVITDERRIYSGCWVYGVVRPYTYGEKRDAKKRGVGFGLDTLMFLLDDEKLFGGAGGTDADTAFGHVSITATANVADKFNAMPAGGLPPAGASIMPGGGHVGQAGGLTTHALPGAETNEERELREMMS